MRIEEIQFKNFRKYVDSHLKFNNNNTNDMHIVIAENGVGKTTFLNAMTWCLYNQEPKIKDKINGLPTLNTDISNNSKNDFEKASVTMTVSGEDTKLIFKRSDIYKIHSIHSEYYKDNHKREEWIEQEFSVTEIIGSNSNVYRDSGDCENLVSSFIPPSIKEFFFFDGEELENYFLISKAIKEQVFTLSHILVLEDMEKRINIKLRELRKEGNPNSKSDEKLKEYESESDLLNMELKRYEKLKETYQNLVNERDELINSLGNTPSISKTEKKWKEKNEQKEELVELVANKKQELNDLIIKESPKIFAKKAFNETLALIEKNKDKNSIYPIDEHILDESIKEHCCKVCDREMDQELINRLEDKKAKLYLISPEDKILNENRKFFEDNNKIISKYLEKENEIQNDINMFNKTISMLESDVKELYKSIELNKHLKENIDRRDLLIDILPNKKSELDSINVNNDNLKLRTEKLYKEYLRLLSDEEEYKDILTKIELCMDSLNVISRVKDDMMNKTKNIIQDSTNEKFFNLIRKSKTYGKIEITDNYEVKLYDEDGRPASSTASASEVELLALAFILAIHSVSGFESPLVVDTLLARTSGEQRINVSKSCLNISEEKQVLLFLIDEEYSSPVQKLFKEKHVNEYKLKESESEKKIKIEVI